MAAQDQTGSVRRVVLFASVVVAVVQLAVLFSWAFQRRLIYLPSTGAVPSAATMLAGARDVQLTTCDGLRLGAWYVPAPTRAGFVYVALVIDAFSRRVSAMLCRGPNWIGILPLGTASMTAGQFLPRFVAK
jgi:uncharacterized protein